MRPIDRRTFLALGVGAVAWACSRGSDEPALPGDEAISLIATGLQGLAVGDTRNAVAVLRGQKPFAPEDLAVRLVPPNGEPFRVEVDRERIRFGRGGEEDHEHPEATEVTDIFVFRHDFDAGVWGVQAIVDDQGAEAAFQVAPETSSPHVGGRAIASQSPTTSDPRGVDPICTRTPPCPMHEMTVAEALRAGKPLVLNFATPRFCQSRTCGPVVDLIEEQRERIGDKASFVHVEVFRNSEVANQPGGDAPTFAEWKLGTEPWTYFIDADGVVKDRWLGAIGRDELRRAVDALVG